jgi:hypothetical protein
LGAALKGTFFEHRIRHQCLNNFGMRVPGWRLVLRRCRLRWPQRLGGAAEIGEHLRYWTVAV